MKALVLALAALAMTAATGLGYAWMAPWSTEMGLVIMEPISLMSGLVSMSAVALVFVILLKLGFPRWFGRGASWLLAAVPLGIAASVYLYPPMDRRIEPSAETLRFVRRGPCRQ